MIQDVALLEKVEHLGTLRSVCVYVDMCVCSVWGVFMIGGVEIKNEYCEELLF